MPVFGIGKIHDIYNGRGVENYVTTKNNADGMEKLHAALTQRPAGLIFANLVDFDMLYGHRKDVEGFARSLEEFDALLGPFLARSRQSDLLLITADHGCDPDPAWPTTDHSREYVPILAYSPEARRGGNLGVRATLADMGQTVAREFWRRDSARRELPSAGGENVGVFPSPRCRRALTPSRKTMRDSSPR